MASKKYLKEYDLVESEDEKGRLKKIVVYRGDYFTLNLDESQIRGMKWNFILIFFVLLGLHVGGGFVSNLSMYKIYVALPYTAAFFPLLYLATGVFRLPSQKRPYRREEIGLSYDRIISTSRLYLIFMAIGLLGGIIYLIFFSNGQDLGREAIFFLLIAAAMLSALMIYQKASKIEINLQQEAASIE